MAKYGFYVLMGCRRSLAESGCDFLFGFSTKQFMQHPSFSWTQGRLRNNQAVTEQYFLMKPPQTAPSLARQGGLLGSEVLGLPMPIKNNDRFHVLIEGKTDPHPVGNSRIQIIYSNRFYEKPGNR